MNSMVFRILSSRSRIGELGNMADLVKRLQEFMVNEARSCSMDFGCVTPLYVYRMWGGQVAIDEIESALTEARRMM